MDNYDSSIKTPIGTLTGGMYYYFISEQEMEKASQVIGNCNAINSVWWSPIITHEDLETSSVDYDIERFGKIEGHSLNFTPQLNKVKSVNYKSKDLGTFKPYIVNRKNQTSRHWSNESRLYNFPYSYGFLTDYMNTPIEIHYHELPTKAIARIKAKGFLSDKGTYSIFVEGLKNDFGGKLEASVSTAPMDIPVSSSAYSNWSSTQKAQDNQNLKNSITNGNNSMVQSGVGAIGSLLNGDIGGALSSGFSIYNAYTQQQQAIGMRDAKMKDLSNTPRSMLSTGSDVGFSMFNGERQLTLFRYSLTDEYKERLGDFFALYGYKQNRLMDVHTRNRYYYNYVKTIGANILNINGIPKAHLNEIKSIYDKGVTIWHIDRGNVRFNNFDNDNFEV